MDDEEDEEPRKLAGGLIYVNKSDIKILSGEDQFGLKGAGVAAVQLLRDIAMPVFDTATAVWKANVRNRVSEIDAKAKVKTEKILAQGQLDLLEIARVKEEREIQLRALRRMAIGTAAVEHARLTSDKESWNKLDPDWVNLFWRLGEDISNEDFQDFWGALLSLAVTAECRPSKQLLHFAYLLSAEQAKEIDRLFGFACSTHDSSGNLHVVIPRKFGSVDRVVMNREDSENAKISDDIQRQFSLTVSTANELLRTNLPPLRIDEFGPAGLYAFSSEAPGARLDKNEDEDIIFFLGNKPFKLGSGLLDTRKIRTPFQLVQGLPLSSLGTQLFELINIPPNPLLVNAFEQAVRGHGYELLEV